MPCAVSGPQVVQALLGLDRAEVGLQQAVEHARLGERALGAAVGAVDVRRGRSPAGWPCLASYASSRWSARKRLWQDWHSVSGSANVVDVAGGHPDLAGQDDRGVEADDVVAGAGPCAATTGAGCSPSARRRAGRSPRRSGCRRRSRCDGKTKPRRLARLTMVSMRSAGMGSSIRLAVGGYAVGRPAELDSSVTAIDPGSADTGRFVSSTPADLAGGPVCWSGARR